MKYILCRIFVISLSLSSGDLNVRFWKRDQYLAGTVGSGRKLLLATVMLHFEKPNS